MWERETSESLKFCGFTAVTTFPCLVRGIMMLISYTSRCRTEIHKHDQAEKLPPESGNFLGSFTKAKSLLIGQRKGNEKIFVHCNIILDFRFTKTVQISKLLIHFSRILANERSGYFCFTTSPALRPTNLRNRLTTLGGHHSTSFPNSNFELFQTSLKIINFQIWK